MKKALRMATLAVVAVLMAGILPGLSRAAVIDNFNNTTFPGASLTAPGMTMFSDMGVAGVAGGTRNITLSASAASSPANNVASSIGGGQAFYSSGATAVGSLNLNYNGASLAADLGGQLAQVSVDFLSFDDAFNQGMDVTVTVSDGTDTADSTQTVTGSSLDPFSLIFQLSLFNNIGAVDLANLTSINFLFDAAQGQDFALSGIQALLVPEPASVLTWCMIGLVVGFFVALRRMRPAQSPQIPE